jgi:hypothetical protein
MRYLSLLFFIFYSSHTFSAQQYLGQYCDGEPGCSNFVASANARDLIEYFGACAPVSPNSSYSCASAYKRCTRPLVNHPSDPSLCVPVCEFPQVLDLPTASCIDPPGGGDNDCEFGEVFDPVTGTVSCADGEGNESSAAASSQSCLVPDDYNGDCIPDDEQSSSTPTSSPDTTSAGSNTSASGGGDDDDDDTPPGGGGDGDGNGSNGGGSGSAAASSTPSGGGGSNSSWTHHTGYGNWIPVAADSNCPNKFKDTSGQWWCAGSGSPNGSNTSAMAIEGSCDYTSKNYFTCITSGNGSNTSAGGSGSDWTPVSGYGNWIPINEDSPCPNKFKDASGKWWCAGGATGGGGGGTGTASSGGAAGSAAAGECDQTASNYLDCISQGKTSSRSSGSASSTSSSSGGSASSTSSNSGAFSSLGDKGEFDGEDAEKSLEDLEEELTKKIADIKADIQGEFGGAISGSGTIQDFCKNIRSTEVCFGLKKFENYLDPIPAAIFLAACFLSFAIVLRK